MIRLLTFFLGWCIGLFVLNQFVFKLMFEFIKNENAVAILCVLLITVFTLTWGILVGCKK